MYLRVSLYVQSISLCANIITFSKTYQDEQIKYTKTPWNIYVKMIPTVEYIIMMSILIFVGL